MDLESVRKMSARSLIEILDRLGMPDKWEVVAEVRRAAGSLFDEFPLADRKIEHKGAFRNLVVGTLAEHIFRDRHLRRLEDAGFAVFDYHERGDNRDFGLALHGDELPINVKVASSQFNNAKSVVGLEPTDCIPVSAYKAIGASERVPALIYVILVDFGLRERVDAVMERLTADLSAGWHMLSSFGGKGAKRAQDLYVERLFSVVEEMLLDLVVDPENFRVISAQRVLAVMRRDPRRVPGLGVKGAGTGLFRAEVNVHVSVRAETRQWSDVADECRSTGIASVCGGILRTERATVPAPSL